MKNFAVAAVFGVVSSLVSAPVAAQQVVECADINGRFLIGLGGLSQQTFLPTGGFVWTINLQAGDVLSVAAPETLELAAGRTNAYPSVLPALSASMVFDGRSVPLPFSYTAANAETVTIGSLNQSGGFISDQVERQTNAGLIQDDPPTQKTLRSTITCVPAANVEDPTSDAAEILSTTSAFHQNTSILTGLRGVRGQNNGRGVQVTQGTAMGFLGDTASGWRAWGFTDFRRYSEAATGSSTTVTLGVDRDMGGMRVGGLLSYDTTSLDDGSGEQGVSSLAIGPYITGNSGAFTYDAFVTYARPDYDLLSGAATGERTAYGLAGEGAFDAGSTVLFPFVTLNGATEDLNGDTLVSRQVSAGMRVEFGGMGAFNPYMSVAYENNRQDSALTGATDHSAPRYGVGFSTVAANGATINVDIDAGESVDNLRDVGLRLSYGFDF